MQTDRFLTIRGDILVERDKIHRNEFAAGAEGCRGKEFWCSEGVKGTVRRAMVLGRVTKGR